MPPERERGRAESLIYEVAGLYAERAHVSDRVALGRVMQDFHTAWPQATHVPMMR